MIDDGREEREGGTESWMRGVIQVSWRELGGAAEPWAAGDQT